MNKDPCPLVKGVDLPPLSDDDWNLEQYLQRLHLMFFSSPLTQTGVFVEGLQFLPHGLL